MNNNNKNEDTIIADSVSDNESFDTSRISISAHYTGFVWYKHGLSHKGFVTPMGRVAYNALKPVNFFLKTMVGANIDTFLLQRHHVLDHLVEQYIEQGYEQIVELAAGLSSRGYLLKKKYPQLLYVEGDLPGMSQRKAELLDKLGRADNHITRPCNILSPEGKLSLEELLADFDPTKKTLVITEGLVNYFELDTIKTVWARLAKAMQVFPQAVYVSEVYPRLENHPSYKYVQLAQKVVGFFTQGSYPLHYTSSEEMKQGFEQDGFAQVTVSEPEDYYHLPQMPQVNRPSLVRLVQAQV